MPLEDIVALYASLVNLALKCYADRIDYVDKALSCAVEVFLKRDAAPYELTQTHAQIHITNTHIRVYTYMYKHAQTHTHAYIHTYKHTYTHMHRVDNSTVTARELIRLLKVPVSTYETTLDILKLDNFSKVSSVPVCKPLVIVKENLIANISVAIQTLSSKHDGKLRNVKEYIKEMTYANYSNINKVQYSHAHIYSR